MNVPRTGSPSRRADASTADWLVALGLGLLALAIRYPGLGRWCLSVDEYYFSKSVGFILESGLPAYPSGGYYVRGLLVQYLSTLPVLFSGDRELGIRLVPLLFGVLTVPAFFLLCRRFLELPSATVAAALLAFSSWHVEFSRFARMYSAFQLVFLVFLFYFHSGFWRGVRRHRIIAVAVALVAVFVHEGAVFLPIILWLALLRDEPVSKREWLEVLAASLVLLAANYAVNGLDYRNLGVTDRLPAEAISSAPDRPPVRLPSLELLSLTLGSTVPSLAWVALAGLSLVAYRSVTKDASSVWSRVFAGLVILAALLQQFGLLTLAALLILLSRRDVLRDCRRHLQAWLVGLLVALVYWSALALASREALAPGSGLPGAVRRTFAVLFLNYPYHYVIVYPFWSHVPLWSAVVVAGLLVAIVRHLWLGRSESTFPVLVVLLCVAFLPIFRTPYSSTRYSFFFFPLLLLILGLECQAASGWLARRASGAVPWLGRGVLVLPFIAVVATEDLQPRHLLHVSSPEVNYRLGRFRKLAAHWYAREDYETPAAYVNRAADDRDVVVVEPPPSRAYLNETFVCYIPLSSRRFVGVAREGGTKELWSGAPLIHDENGLVALVPSDPARSLWLVAAVREIPGAFTKEPDTPPDIARRHGLEVSLAAVGEDRRVGVWRFRRAS